MKYKVSVIIPAYNAEKSIERAIQSIYNQNFDGIEIIIVNDGSTDLTLKKIEEIQSLNNNVIIINQENFGVSVARNAGLAVARGEYITFLDADDAYPNNIFSKIYKFVTSEQADLFIGNIECFNDVRKWRLSYMKDVFKGRKVFSTTLEKSPEIQLSPSVCNKWFKKQLLEGMVFNPEISVAEDLLFTEQCYIKAKKIAMADWIIYRYRVVKTETLSKKSTIAFFSDLVKVQKKLLQISDKERQDVSFVCKRKLKFFINSIYLKKEILKEELDELMQAGIELFNISKNHIQFPLFKDTEKNLLAFLFSKKDKTSIQLFLHLLNENKVIKENIVKKERVYSYLLSYFPKYETMLCIEPQASIRVEDINLNGCQLTISGYAFIRGFNTEKQKKTLIFTNVKTGEVKKIILEDALRTDLTYLFKKDSVVYNFAGFKAVDINVVDFLGDGTWEASVFIEVGEQYSLVSKLLVPLAEIKNKAKGQEVKIGRNLKRVFCSYEEGKHLHVNILTLISYSYLKSKIRQLKRNFLYDLGLLKKNKYKSFIAVYSYRLVGRFLRNKEIWLMGERSDTAQDNTYHLFNYIRKTKPEINAYYVIEKDAKDRKYIEKLGNIIDFGSLKHTLYLMCAKTTINSYVERPNMYTEEYKEIIKYYPEFVQNKKVFLQHGVIGVSRVNHVLHKNRVNYALFVTSSQFEKNHIVKEFGYSEDEVIVTGLPRWDNLNKNLATKKILLMPTWRSWIQSEEELRQSEYFNRYMDLITNKHVIRLLEDYDYELVFYPHYQVQRIITDNTIHIHDRIRIVRQGERRVQDLLNECEILLTDYSTVAFDFAYMEKPVIFYQFDYSEFYSKHYNEGPIQHKKQLFGPVVEKIDDVVAKIEAFLIGRENLDDYKKRIGLFIEKQQKSHNERVFDEIMKINKGKSRK